MAARQILAHDRRNRHFLRRDRIFRDRTNPLDTLTDGELLGKYRLTRQGIIFLCNMLQEQLGRSTQRSHAIPVPLQVMTGLHFLACGSFQQVIGDSMDIGLSQASVSRIVSRFVSKLSDVRNEFIKFPTSASRIQHNQNKFFNQHHIPDIVRLIDSTHIQIIAPHANEEVYVNRLNYHSINTKIIVDFDCRITNVVAKWPGSVHDSTIVNNSLVKSYFEEPRNYPVGILLGDSGYACRNWLLTPYRVPQNPQQERFNRFV